MLIQHFLLQLKSLSQKNKKQKNKQKKKQPQQKWELTGNQLANKGYHCRHFSYVQSVRDPNENATVAHAGRRARIAWMLSAPA